MFQSEILIRIFEIMRYYKLGMFHISCCGLVSDYPFHDAVNSAEN